MPLCKCGHPASHHRVIPDTEDICSRYRLGICGDCEPCAVYRPQRNEHRAT